MIGIRIQKLLLAFIILFFCYDMPLFAQTFQPNKQGYISDPKFKELIKASGYQIVGAFISLSDIIPISTGAPVKYAQGIKGGRKIFITPNGKQLNINSLRENYIPKLSTGFGESSEITIDGPVKDENEKFEQVLVNGKYGTINIITKKIGLPAIYDGITWYSHGLVSIKANGKEGFATTEGKILLEPKYESIGSFGKRGKNGRYPFYNIYLNKKWGLMNSEYKEIVPPAYDMVLSVYLHPNLFIIQNNKLQGLVDQYGKSLTQMIYSRFEPSKQHLPLIGIVNNKKGLIDSMGKVLIEPIYDEISYSGLERSFKLTKDRKYGIANETGKIVLQPDYDYIYELKDNVAIIKKGSKFGALNEKWNFVVPLDYDQISIKGSYLSARKGEEASLFDFKGKKIIQGNFEEIYPVGNKLFFKADGKYGFMTLSGKKLKKLEYDSIVVENGFLIVVKNGKYGVIDADGHDLIPTKYDFFIGSEGAFLQQNIVEAKLGGKKFLVDFYGNEYAR